MPVVPRNLPTKYWLNMTEEKGVIKALAWLPWQLNYHSNKVAGWCQGISMSSIDSIRLKKKVVTKVLPWLLWQLSYHSNVVVVWCLSCRWISIPNSDSTWRKKKELLRFHHGCHGNWVTISTGWLMPVVSRNLHTKYWLITVEDKGVIKVSPWLPWQLCYYSNEVVGWCLSCQGTSMPNTDAISLKEKKLLRFTLVTMAIELP